MFTAECGTAIEADTVASFADLERASADFCATDKSIARETCQPVLENTVDLRYDLKCELDIVELLIDESITMFV